MWVNFPHFFILPHARCLSLHPSCYKGVDRLLPISFHLRGCHALVIALPLRKNNKSNTVWEADKEESFIFSRTKKKLFNTGLRIC